MSNTIGFKGYIEDHLYGTLLIGSSREHWRSVWNGWRLKTDCMLTVDGFTFTLNKMMSKKEFYRHYGSFEFCARAWVNAGFDVLIVPTFFYTERVMIYTRE